MHFTVYSKPACPFCDQAKALIKQKGFTYDELVLDVGQPKRDTVTYINRTDLLVKYPSAKTMPQISVHESAELYIGGFTDLKKYFESKDNASQ